MNPDEALTTALRQTASEIPVGPAPIDAVVRGSRAIRRRRRTVAMAVAAVVVTPACLLAVRATTTPPPPAGAGPASAGAPAHTAAQLMMPGQKFTAFAGTTLWLTRLGLCLASPAHPDPYPDSVLVADTRPGQVAAMMASTGPRAVWAGVYRGPGTPDKITLTIGDRTLPVRLYTLAGHPGWIAFAADTAASGRSTDKPTLRAYATDGTLLLSTRL
jgi:hypothetical protein